jgi:hypothetical protein
VDEDLGLAVLDIVVLDAPGIELAAKTQRAADARLTAAVAPTTVSEGDMLREQKNEESETEELELNFGRDRWIHVSPGGPRLRPRPRRICRYL